MPEGGRICGGRAPLFLAAEAGCLFFLLRRLGLTHSLDLRRICGGWARFFFAAEAGPFYFSAEARAHSLTLPRHRKNEK